MLNKRGKKYFSSFNLWVFIILLIFSITFYTVKGSQKLNIIKEVSTVILYPLQKTIIFTRNIFSLYRKNRVLEKKIATISLEIQRCKNIKRENKILRELYGFKPMTDFNLIPSEIIGKSPGLYNRSIIINRGTKDGIEKNMPVISADGLVGKIFESKRKTSELLTLYNRNSFVSAIDLRSRVQGLVKWQRGEFLVLDDVPLHSDIRIGDTLLTSGMGSVYPKGIFIGKVRKVEENPTEIVMQIKVESFVNFSLLEDVFVIIESEASFFSSPSDTETTKVVMVHLDMFHTIKDLQCFSSFFFKNNSERIGFSKTSFLREGSVSYKQKARANKSAW